MYRKAEHVIEPVHRGVLQRSFALVLLPAAAPPPPPPPLPAPRAAAASVAES